jgi:hypothetical protein
MVNKITAWIKENKLSTVLIGIIVLFFGSNAQSSSTMLDMTSVSKGRSADSLMVSEMAAPLPPVGGGGAPRLEIPDRKVVTNSNLSLVVTDVKKAINDIKVHTKGLGGYMVDSSQTAPEGLATGSITVRVPSDQLDIALDYLSDIAVKVVSERITGTDITDEYVDVEARLKTLRGTKVRYESILDKAEDVDDIMRVTQQILYIQDQIDRLMGQLTYMDATSSSSLITIYLSTDEFELPYSPEQPWRPKVVFKYAVRSLVQTLREVGSSLIWALTYAVIWVPILIIVLIIRKKQKTNNQN